MIQKQIILSPVLPAGERVDVLDLPDAGVVAVGDEGLHRVQQAVHVDDGALVLNPALQVTQPPPPVLVVHDDRRLGPTTAAARHGGVGGGVDDGRTDGRTAMGVVRVEGEWEVGLSQHRKERPAVSRETVVTAWRGGGVGCGGGLHDRESLLCCVT